MDKLHRLHAHGHDLPDEAPDGPLTTERVRVGKDFTRRVAVQSVFIRLGRDAVERKLGIVNHGVVFLGQLHRLHPPVRRHHVVFEALELPRLHRLISHMEIGQPALQFWRRRSWECRDVRQS